MNRKLIALALAGALAFTPVLAAEADKFPAVQDYPGYSDVRETDWFYDNAKLCYETGIITGTDKGFEPGKILTGPECAAMAARLREGLTGKPIPAFSDPSLPWYQPYVDYLEEAAQESGSSLYGLIKWYDKALFEGPATRYDFLVFMALAADGSEDYFPALNALTFADIPDVTDDNVVLRFYNIGILTGKDAYGTFDAQGTLSRAEAAAMVSRMARPELRKTFTTEDYSPFTAAHMTPSTVLFSNGVTAEAYLREVNGAIAKWERALEEDFNWHRDTGDGKTVLTHVKEDTLAALGVTAKEGTQAYQDFDVQVYYARLISLTGTILG